MSVYSGVADYVWLTGDEARAILDDLGAEDLPLHTALTRLRGKVNSDRARWLFEQVRLRRLGSAKFTQAHQMFFTRVGLEQATDEWVAAYKASRLAGQRAGASSPPSEIVDLCCGIGGDLTQLVKRRKVMGVDLDPITAHFAAVNSGARVQRVDVAEVDVRSLAAWHIDPDRRPSGKRTTSLDYSKPDLETIERMLGQNANAAIKLAPATRVPVHWSEQCELEWISRDRECRQLVAWHGELAQSPGLRRATVVARDQGVALRTVVGEPNQPITTANSPDRFVFDIDSAVLAAHLKGALAAECNLKALSAGATYLTGPQPFADPALYCFEVTDVMPFDKRRLAQYLREHNIGTLEIKKRGVELNPEVLRGQLKLRGDGAATLLVTPVAGRTTAILARRLS
jgi:hypothetical protein